MSNKSQPLSGAAQPAPQPEDWRNVPVGHWFFLDSPACHDRYSVQERTSSGHSLICSTPWHYDEAKREMQEIAKNHNRLAAPEEAPPTRPTTNTATWPEGFATPLIESAAPVAVPAGQSDTEYMGDALPCADEPLPPPQEPKRDKNGKPTLPVGVSVLITDAQGRLLLGKRKNNSGAGLFSTPGGRIEQDENMMATAIRETREETGLTLAEEDLEVIAFKELFRFGNHYIMFYVHARNFSGDAINTEPEKCEGWQWFTLDEIELDKTTEPSDVIQALRVNIHPAALAGETRTETMANIQERYSRAINDLAELESGEMTWREKAKIIPGEPVSYAINDSLADIPKLLANLAAAASRIAQLERERDAEKVVMTAYFKGILKALGLPEDIAVNLVYAAQELRTRAETAEAALTQALAQNDVCFEKWAKSENQKSALMEAIGPYIEENCELTTNVNWQRALQAYEQVKKEGI